MSRLGRPPEDRRRRRLLGAAPAADPTAGREMERRLSSEFPMHVQVSLIDRGVRFDVATFRDVPPRSLPAGTPLGTARRSERVHVSGSERGVRA